MQYTQHSQVREVQWYSLRSSNTWLLRNLSFQQHCWQANFDLIIIKSLENKSSETARRGSTNIIAIKDYIVILFHILQLGEHYMFTVGYWERTSSCETLSDHIIHEALVSCNSGTNTVDLRKEKSASIGRRTILTEYTKYEYFSLVSTSWSSSSVTWIYSPEMVSSD